MDIIFILGRILVGGYFVYSGYNHFAHIKNLTGYAASKKVPLPKISILFTGLLLVLGGAYIGFWQYVDLGAVFLIVFLVPTTIMMHDFWNEKDSMAKMNSQIGFSKNVALIGFLLILLSKF